MEEIRLNKYLSGMGVCSRREADRLIGAGRVLVDGEKAVAGMKVREGQRVICDGEVVGGASPFPVRGVRSVSASDGLPRPPADEEPRPSAGDAFGPVRGAAPFPSVSGAGADRSGRPRPVLLAAHKPRGVVCTTSRKDRAPTIVEMVDYPTRVYPVGRLDKDSEGLILLTNQGDLVNRILRGGGHEKEYVVAVDKPVTGALIDAMKAGVWLEELREKTKPCRAWISGKREFHIVLTQGLNRQIRRMCGALGYQVQGLKRIRIMNVRLGDLKAGTFREVTGREFAELLRQLG